MFFQRHQTVQSPQPACAMLSKWVCGWVTSSKEDDSISGWSGCLYCSRLHACSLIAKWCVNQTIKPWKTLQLIKNRAPRTDRSKPVSQCESKAEITLGLKNPRLAVSRLWLARTNFSGPICSVRVQIFGPDEPWAYSKGEELMLRPKYLALKSLVIPNYTAALTT